MRFRLIPVCLLLLLLIPSVTGCFLSYPFMTSRRGFPVTRSEAMQYDSLRDAGMSHAQARQTIQMTRESERLASKPEETEEAEVSTEESPKESP